MQWNSCESQITQHQRNTLSVSTSITEDHEGISSKLIQKVDKVNILSYKQITTY